MRQLWHLTGSSAHRVYLQPKTFSARVRKKTYEMLWRRVPHLDTTKWTELCISFRTITHSNYGKKDSKSITNIPLKFKKVQEKKFHKSSSVFRGICKNVNFNTWNRSQPIITQTHPERKESERANVRACVRTHVCRSDGDGSKSSSNRETELGRGCGIEILLLTYGPLALHLGRGNRQRHYLELPWQWCKYG